MDKNSKRTGLNKSNLGQTVPRRNQNVQAASRKAPSTTMNNRNRPTSKNGLPGNRKITEKSTTFLQPPSPEPVSASTSTPEKEGHVPLASINLSNISVTTSENTFVKKRKTLAAGHRKPQAGDTKKNKNGMNELNIVYDKYLLLKYMEAEMKKELEEKNAEEHRHLIDIRGKVMLKQLEVQKLHKQLQTFQVCSDIASHTKDLPDCSKILEQIKTEQIEEKLDNMSKYLESHNDTLLLENIQAPQNIKSALCRGIAEASEAVDKLKQQFDSMDLDTKVKCSELEEKCEEGFKRCKEKLSDLGNLALYHKSLETDIKKSNKAINNNLIFNL